tara:strand:- start:337 stop:465 length:129 start_codon:yes stop_codon:yes gene_type:complete
MAKSQLCFQADFLVMAEDKSVGVHVLGDVVIKPGWMVIKIKS